MLTLQTVGERHCIIPADHQEERGGPQRLRLNVSATRLPGGLETTLHVSRMYPKTIMQNTACQDLTDNSPEGLAFSDERSVLLETAVQLVQMSIVIRPAAAEQVTDFKTILVYV